MIKCCSIFVKKEILPFTIVMLNTEDIITEINQIEKKNTA
jgi:hypothetical protein